MFPAQALGETLTADGWHVSLVTDARGRRHVKWLQEDRVVEVEAASISPRKPIHAIRGSLKLLRGTNQAIEHLRAPRADIVAGFGGYPAFPALHAARKLRIPFVLHEQNTVLGRVNRVFAKRADVVASGFETLRRLPSGVRHVTTGNPLRAQIRAAIPDTYTPPGNTETFRLLIVGGSLGARVISRTVPEAIGALPEAVRRRLSVVQQTTEDQLEFARRTYADAGVDAELATFFGDIERHLAKAHLVIARAGASSVSEIAAMGKPSVLVPLAIAMDDHQTVNAQALAGRNAAVLMPESTFTSSALTELLEERIGDSHWLESAARAARSAAHPDATERLAQLVRSLAS